LRERGFKRSRVDEELRVLESADEFIDQEQKIQRFNGDASRMKGFIEVRGIVNKDGTMTFGEYTQYDDSFGKK
jgi:hypothetical protein